MLGSPVTGRLMNLVLQSFEKKLHWDTKGRCQ